MSFHFKHQLEEDNARLKTQHKALVSLVEEILSCIPETYLTGFGWDNDLEEIEKDYKQIKEGE